MGAISRMMTAQRFTEWAKKNGKWDEWEARNVPILYVTGGIPEIQMGCGYVIVDIDHLNETNEGEIDYEEHIQED